MLPRTERLKRGNTHGCRAFLLLFLVIYDKTIILILFHILNGQRKKDIHVLTVLLVDDDAEFTEVACTIIEFLGHDVLTAATLAEARDWLEKETLRP